MTFTGFNRPCDHGKGGVCALQLLPVSGLLSCAYDQNGYIHSIMLREGCNFEDIQFVEHSASFRQSTSGEYPHTSVIHELTFDIARNNPAACNCLQMISDFEADGFVAIIKLNSGDAFLAGWSKQFNADYPLVPSALLSISGSSPDDDPYCRITLRSKDTAFALPFTGNLMTSNPSPTHPL